jgi:hypothetical protein
VPNNNLEDDEALTGNSMPNGWRRNDVFTSFRLFCRFPID